MAGFIPAIHVLLNANKTDVDGRDKPGHDGIHPSDRHIFLLARRLEGDAAARKRKMPGLAAGHFVVAIC
ncbi:MAG: hypothetical protein WBF99_13255 [Xanthobacteraceae bacterium]